MKTYRGNPSPRNDAERADSARPRARHTPGPWRATPGGTIWAADEHRPANAIADVYSCTAGTPRGQNAERNGNARLMAKSPEMLELLKRAKFIFEQNGFDDHAETIGILVDEIENGGGE